MKNKLLTLGWVLLATLCWAQKKGTSVKKPLPVKIKPTLKAGPDLTKLHNNLPELIPFRKDGKMGYINQKNQVLIKPQYNLAAFFYEDCNLLNSPNEKVRKFGSGDYASVSTDDADYRIDKNGKRVYTFRKEDLGTCEREFKKQKFHAYIQNGYYGLIEDGVFINPQDYRQFKIYPQYHYMHILEGEDIENPRIIAVKNDAFGVIDKDNKVVIPFEYADIKRNFSFKIGNLFEVSKDGKNYFFVDENNNIFHP